MNKVVITNSALATQRFGERMGCELVGGEVLALAGNLGSGKTTFIKGIARGLGVKQVITSPTFVLMKVYSVKQGRIRQFVHVDCYRVPGIELEKIGLGDYLGRPDTVVAIEWAEKLPRNIKPSHKFIFKVGQNPKKRIIQLELPAKFAQKVTQNLPKRAKRTAQSKDQNL